MSGALGLPVDLEVADHHMALVSEMEELGAWPLEAVKARRLRGDTFAITVAGEDLHFVAGDPISFAYKGMPVIQRFTRSRTRSPFRALLRLFGPDPSERNAQPEPTPSPTDEPLVVQEDASNPDETPASMSQVVAEDEVVDAFEDPPIQDSSIESTTTSEQDLNSQPGQIPILEFEPATVPSETRVCRALRNDGLPCQSPVVGPSGYCSSHDPDRALGKGFRKAQEARGRLHRKGTVRLNKVYTRLDKAFKQVERGDLDPDKAMGHGATGSNYVCHSRSRGGTNYLTCDSFYRSARTASVRSTSSGVL